MFSSSICSERMVFIIMVEVQIKKKESRRNNTVVTLLCAKTIYNRRSTYFLAENVVCRVKYSHYYIFIERNAPGNMSYAVLCCARYASLQSVNYIIVVTGRFTFLL